MTIKTIWDVTGKNKYYEFYRSDARFEILRKWIDKKLFHEKLINYLDRDFVDSLRDRDFYGRLWELQLSDLLKSTDIQILPTNGIGPDFCLILKSGEKVWIEAVNSNSDEQLDELNDEIIHDSVVTARQVPRKEIALRYTTSLFAKSKKIKEKYSNLINSNDFMIIAITGYTLPFMGSDINSFLPAVLPIGFPVVYFSKNGKRTKNKTTHTNEELFRKDNNSEVEKTFLYPGSDHSHVDGVIFSEASVIQQLLGVHATGLESSESMLHLFHNYSGKKIPEELNKKFYFHTITSSKKYVSLRTIEPSV